MTDPYPERRRRDRLDRSDHRRVQDNRRGPTPKQVQKALEDVADHDVPGTPNVGALKALKEVHSTEWAVDEREVRDFRVTRGDPQHGAHRSDDHVGRYELELPIYQVDDEAVPGHECPECGGERALYKYHANHFIAGSESIFCLSCEVKLYGEEWG